MRKTPIYGFDDLSQTGINLVPNFSHVFVEDAGDGKTRLYMKTSNLGLTAGSTVNDFLNNHALYEDVYSYDPVSMGRDPGASDDSTKKYKIGQVFVNYMSGESFILVDNTPGSATWKLAGKMTANDILAELLTVDGPGSLLDADRLDGQEGANYFLKAGNNTVTGNTTWMGSNTWLGINTIHGNNPTLKFNDIGSGDDDFYLRVNNNSFSVLTDRDDDDNWEGLNPLVLNNATSKGYVYGDEVLTTASTTINAATLNGINDTQFLRSDVNDTGDGDYTFNGDNIFNGDNEFTGTFTISRGWPHIKLNNTSVNADDFWMYTSADQFVIASDIDDDGTIDAPNALVLRNATNDGLLYSKAILTEDSVISGGTY